MRRRRVGPVEVLQPENEADERALERRRREGTLDTGLRPERPRKRGRRGDAGA